MKFTIIMSGPYPPLVSTMNGKTFAVSGSHWVEILQDISDRVVNIIWKRPIQLEVVKPKELRKEFLSSKGDKVYHTVVRSDGVKGCSCSGFKYRGRCRHIDELRKELV